MTAHFKFWHWNLSPKNYKNCQFEVQQFEVQQFEVQQFEVQRETYDLEVALATVDKGYKNVLLETLSSFIPPAPIVVIYNIISYTLG